MINIDEVQEILKKDLNFSDIDLQKLTIFNDEILKYLTKNTILLVNQLKKSFGRGIFRLCPISQFYRF